MRILNRFCTTVVAGVISMICASSAFASNLPAPPPAPPLSSKGDCGWGLGAAAAAEALLVALKGGSPSAGKWSGLYAGGQLGCAVNSTDWTFQNVSAYNSAAGQSTSFNHDQIIGGGIVGYNFQFGRWVTGVELTLSSGLSREIRNPFNPVPLIFNERLSADIGPIFTATGRLGYLVDPRWLVYGKGGFASAEVTAGLWAQSAAGSFPTLGHERHYGWTAGVGIEYMLDNNIILGAGYDYISLGDEAYRIACVGCGGTPILLNVDPGAIHVFQGRMTYRWGQ